MLKPAVAAALSFLAVLLLPARSHAGIRVTAPAAPVAPAAPPLTGVLRLYHLAPSPDGKELAVGVSSEDRKVNQVWRVNLRRAEDSRVLLELGSTVTALAFSPDGAVLAVGTGAGEVKLLSLADGRELPAPALKNPAGAQIANSVNAFSFSADGETLALGACGPMMPMPSWKEFQKGVRDVPQPTLLVWSLRRGALLFEEPQGAVETVAFSPSGKQLSFALREGPPRWVDAATGAALSPASVEAPAAKRTPALELVERLNLLKVKDGATGKGRCVVSGRDSRLREPVLSTDGGEVFLIGSDAVVRGFDTERCEELHVLAPWQPVSPVVVLQTSAGATALAFSPDGQRLASANPQGTVALWDTQTGLVSRLLRGRGERIFHLAFEPAGGRLFGGSEGGFLFSWDTFAGTREFTHDPADYSALLGPPGAVTMVATSPDGRFVAWGNQDGNVRIYEASGSRSQLMLKLLSGESPVRAATFDPSGDVLVTVSEAGVSAFDTTTLKEKWSAKISARPELKDVRAVAASADGQTLACGVRGGVALLSLSSGALLGKLPASPGFPVQHLSFHPDGVRLAVGTDAKAVTIFDAAKRRTLRALPARRESITALGFSPDRRVLAVASDQAVELVSADEGAPLRRLAGLVRPQGVLAFQPEGTLMATAGPDGRVHVWDLAAAKLERTLVPAAGAELLRLSLSLDGSLLALGRADGVVELWAVKEERRIGAVKLPGPSAFLRFEKEGKDLVAGGGGVVILVSTRDAHEWNRITAPAPFTLGAITQDCRRAVTVGADGQVSEWEITSGSVLHTLKGGSHPHVVAVSPDGRLAAVATAAPGSTVATQIDLWDLETGTLRNILEGHAETINALAFSPDGASLASGSGNPDSFAPAPKASPDRSVRLWSTGNGKPLLRPNQSVEAMLAVAFRPGGEVLAVAMSDGEILFIPIGKDANGLKMVAVGEDDWAIVTAEGEYAASRAAASGLGIRAGNRVFPFDQYDLQLNRPDKVAAALGVAAESSLEPLRRAYASRVRRMGLEKGSLGHPFELPQVRVDRDKLPLTTAARKLTFSLHAYDSRGGLDRLMVYVNDVPVNGRGGLPVKKGESRLRQDVTVELSAGRNVLQVSALNADGAESLRETFEVTLTAKPAPTLYLLVVGVSKYLEPLPALDYPVKDARDLAAHFRKQGGRLGKVQVKELLDADVTRAGFASGQAFLRQSGVDDLAIVFLAGHGLRDGKGDYYFATSDTDADRPQLAGLSQDLLNDVFEGVPARRRLLLMDTCLSGELDEDTPEAITAAPDLGPGVKVKLRGVKLTPGKSGSVPLRKVGVAGAAGELQSAFADLRRGSGALVIGSASGRESAIETPLFQNGAFTYALLEGMGKLRADRNKNGSVEVSELRDYVIRRVRGLTREAQTPTVNRDNLLLDYPISW